MLKVAVMRGQLSEREVIDRFLEARVAVKEVKGYRLLKLTDGVRGLKVQFSRSSSLPKKPPEAATSYGAPRIHLRPPHLQRCSSRRAGCFLRLRRHPIHEHIGGHRGQVTLCLGRSKTGIGLNDAVCDQALDAVMSGKTWVRLLPRAHLSGKE